MSDDEELGPQAWDGAKAAFWTAVRNHAIGLWTEGDEAVLSDVLSLAQLTIKLQNRCAALRDQMAELHEHYGTMLSQQSAQIVDLRELKTPTAFAGQERCGCGCGRAICSRCGSELICESCEKST